MVIPQWLIQCFPTTSQLNWQPESFVLDYLLLGTQKMEIMFRPKAQAFFPALRSTGDMQCFGSQDLLQLLLVGDWKRLASSNIRGCYEDGFSFSLEWMCHDPYWCHSTHGPGAGDRERNGASSPPFLILWPGCYTCPMNPWGFFYAAFAIFALAAMWSQFCRRFMFSYYSEPLPAFSWET